MMNELNSSHLNIIDTIKLRGREFTDDELSTIRESVINNFDKGRTYISRDICNTLNWKQPNGWLKDRACRDVLLELEKREIIKLPPPLVVKNNKKSNKGNSISYLKNFDLNTPISEFPNSIELEFAKGNIQEKVWNELVNQYHYLGHSTTVGRCIKYLIRSNDRLLGALSFSSPAWELETRNNILNSIGIENPRDYTINNSRFLILPIVQVNNLASHVLAIAAKKIVNDWKDYYSIIPLIAETFVQPSRFDGTCYKAANWIEIGTTKGYAKRGRFYRNSQEPKKIFLYGLDKRIRTKLLQLEK